MALSVRDSRGIQSCGTSPTEPCGHEKGSEVIKKVTARSLLALAVCVGAAASVAVGSPADAGARTVKPRCRVPSVVGKSLGVAKVRIRKAHCRVGSVRYVRSTAGMKNRVVSQRPTRGRKLANGARVRLVVGRGPGTSPLPPPPPPLVPPPPPASTSALRFNFSQAVALALPQPGATAMESSESIVGESVPQAALNADVLAVGAQAQSSSGGSSNLSVVTASGAVVPAITSGSADVRQFFIAPDDKVYVVFTRPINLSDPTKWDGPKCLLAEVDRTTGVPSCIDGTLMSINWPYPGSGGNPPIQFDAAGAVYYSGWTMTGGTVLRKYLNGISTDIVSDNIQLRDFLVLSNGDVLLSGSSTSSGAQWLRRLTAGGSLQTLRGAQSHFLRLFPDGNVYIGLTGGTDFGVARYLTSTNQMDAKSWYHGVWNPPHDAYYQAADLCDGPLWTIREAFCNSYGAYIRNEFETSDGEAFVVAGGAMLVKYYPTIAFPTTSVEKVLASVGAGDEIVLAGLNDAGQNKTVVYHPATDTETQVIGPDNEIEMYHLTYTPDGNSVMFEGLRFSDNHVVLGQIDLNTGAVTVSTSLPSRLQDLQAFH